jgi:uncharacterized metal-binding protein YceD (DUF177 family)
MSEALSLSVAASEIPPAGKHFHLEPSEADRRRLATALGIPQVTALSADLNVRHAPRQAFSVRGRVVATVVQSCVVTLKPISQEVREEIDLTLSPAGGTGRSRKQSDEDEFIDADSSDRYHNGRIDLGAIVAEHLALGLDPYPRAPGVAFAGHIEDDSTKDPSPFAALAELRRKDD